MNEFILENTDTNEQLTVRNAIFEKPMNGDKIHYVQILRYPMGAEAKMWGWIEANGRRLYQEADERVISIGGWPSLTIG